MTQQRRPIPVYTTRGDVGAFLLHPYLFDPQGDWIGWLADQRQVYSVQGIYVGWLSDDPRVLRHISSAYEHPRRKPPSPPGKFHPPASTPLAPMMPELTMGTIDVLEEFPELLSPVDFGDLREDMA